MALSLDTVSSPDTNVAALQRLSRHAAGKTPRHADPVAEALVEGGGAVSCGPPPARLALACAPLRLRRRPAADRLRFLRDVSGRVGEPHDRPAVGAARPLHHQLLVDRGRMHERHRRLPGPSQATASAAGPAEALASRTAIVMPVYNEQTARTFAAVEAIRDPSTRPDWEAPSITSSSPTSTNPDAWIAEERAFLDLRSRLGPNSRLYYRHRPKNHHRKAGNIADFVRRWGGHYDHVLVLDADSLMTGECIVRALAEADPDAGIIQTLPSSSIATRSSPGSSNSPPGLRPRHRHGLSTWMGRDGNYWGHNAIIRTKARGPCRPARSQGQAADRRTYPEPRLRGGGAHPARGMDGLHAAGSRGLL